MDKTKIVDQAGNETIVSSIEVICYLPGDEGGFSVFVKADGKFVWFGDYDKKEEADLVCQELDQVFSGQKKDFNSFSVGEFNEVETNIRKKGENWWDNL